MASVIYHPDYRNYSFSASHSFSPLRVDIMLDLLASLGHRVETIAPEPATPHDVMGVHSDYYVRRVAALGAGQSVPDAMEYGLGTPDNPIFPNMDEAARLLVGGALHGARMIDAGAKRVLQLGGGLHHARRNMASGFCIYNDVAIAIQWLINRGLWVAYLDIDVHHGDGVQQIHYEEKRVLTMSFHESGEFLFPGTGRIQELGAGLGRGLKLNVPLQPFTEGESYIEVLDLVVPAALRQFRPGVLVVETGADAHYDDPLADLMLTTRDYERIFQRILQWADEFTAGRVLFLLGGGYSFHATPRVWALLYLMMHGLPIPDVLPERWRARWSDAMGGNAPARFHDGPIVIDADREGIAHHNRHLAERLVEAAKPYWF